MGLTQATVIDGEIKVEKDKGKKLALASFSGTCNRCGQRGHKEAECYAKKHMNGHTLTPKNNNNGDMGSNTDQNSEDNAKETRFQGIVITEENSGTKKQIVERRWLTPRTTIRKQQQVPFLMDILLNFCYVSRMKLVVWGWEQQPRFP